MSTTGSSWLRLHIPLPITERWWNQPSRREVVTPPAESHPATGRPGSGERLAPAMNPSPAAAPGRRVVRAMPFAAVCVVVSALGHGAAGGGSVPTRALLLGAGVVLALAAALAGRERSLPSIATALATGQIGLHLLFHSMTMG